MPVTATPIFPQAPRTTATGTTSSGTSIAYTAGANGSKVDAMAATTTTTCDITLTLDVAGTTGILGVINLPTNAGQVNSVPAVDILRHPNVSYFSFDAFGNKCLYLSPNQVLYVKTTVTTGVIFVQGADF